MTMIKAACVRAGVAVAALLVAGCGTEHVAAGGVGAGTPSRSVTVAPTPSGPLDFPCPGESPTAAPTRSASGTDPAPVDKYAENNGFKMPIPLHGQPRCDGLEAAKRVEGALEALRKKGNYQAESAKSALAALGYAPEKVQVFQNPTGVNFLIDASRMCLEGSMDKASTKADAFGGYPDHSGCDVPRGGH
ncbi:hypothetical protein [Kitasatospora aureofaciens]|uniref:hypothetical protein n=1 Tax=Kitasatospora aureofaciens TaxID=1894 RepID=UPI0037F51138